MVYKMRRPSSWVVVLSIVGICVFTLNTSDRYTAEFYHLLQSSDESVSNLPETVTYQIHGSNDDSDGSGSGGGSGGGIDDVIVPNGEHRVNGIPAEKIDDEERKKPFAVIHVGPHKTGSTTIQKFLTQEYNIRRLWKQDGYRVFKDENNTNKNEKKNHASLAVCLNRDPKWRDLLLKWCPDENYEAQVKTDFVEFLAEAAGKSIWWEQHNMVISSEELDREGIDIDWLKEHVEPLFEVRIVLYYRRFYEWMGSYVNQLGKTYMDELRKGGRGTVSPLGRWLEENIDDLSKQHASNVYRRYARYFDGREAITILDFHDPESSLLNSFLCKALPGAPSTCSASRKNPNARHANPRRSLDFRLIEEGINDWSPATVRKDGRVRLETMWEELQKAHPEPPIWMEGEPAPDETIRRLCPSRALLDKILDMSRRFEADISEHLPESAKRYGPMEDEFEDELAKSYCTLDVDHVLQHWDRNDEWFRNLYGSGNKRRKRTGKLIASNAAS